MEDDLTRLGSSESPFGMPYLLKDREDWIKMYADVFEATFKMNGGILTPEIKNKILALARNKQDKIDRQVDALGVPEKLAALFQIRAKSKLKHYCRKLIICEKEIAVLAHNCSQIGYTHKFKFPIYVPENLEISNADIDNLHKGNPTAFLKKTNSRLDGQEKRILVDLFEKGSEWHCFYNSYQDAQSDNNHWEYGSHIHFVNYLWPNHSKKEIWESFDKRSTDISDSFHIRYEKTAYPPPNIPW
jgi:hypothetical protein